MTVFRCTDDFNGAQLKAVSVEAGMIALRRKAEELTHEDYMDGRLRGDCVYQESPLFLMLLVGLECSVLVFDYPGFLLHMFRCFVPLITQSVE